MLRSTPTASPTSEGAAVRLPTACIQCARSKVRCEKDKGDLMCKRCQRLNKQCSIQVPGTHKRKKPKTLDVARLEAKLDGVTAILEASGRIEGTRNVDSNPLISTSSFLSQPGFFDPAACAQYFVENDSESISMITHFHNDMAPQIPFIIVPSTVSPAELRQTRPFLNIAILMMSCGHDFDRQSSIAKKLRELMSYHTLVKGIQSLDLLQCIMLYISWYHFHLKLGPQLTNLVYLMTSMMMDLGLHKAPSLRGNSKLPIGSDRQLSLEHRAPPARTLEERRTFLGCFYISSIVSICARDIDPIRYSRYADECCNALTEAAEYPSDTYIVQLMNLHRLSDKIGRTLAMIDFTHPVGLSTPIGAYVKSLQSESKLQKDLLPVDTSFNSTILLMHYCNIEIYLYEIALGENPNTLEDGNYPFTRLDILFACLSSTKNFFDTMASFPISAYVYSPYTIWTQAGHAIITLLKLSLFVGDGWDLDYVRSIIDFSNLIDTLIQQLEEAKRCASQQVDNESYSKALPEIIINLPPRLQHVKYSYERKLAEQSRHSGITGGSSLADNETAIPGTLEDGVSGPGINVFEFLDEQFWQEFM
ncbi:hypothetical protein F5884DRAFT_809868 [Xylogone sp. PMI_703]|nr:hypothetical protein F5884DRAFT_809868 [Xylogone sp. PMI_703]